MNSYEPEVRFDADYICGLPNKTAKFNFYARGLEIRPGSSIRFQKFLDSFLFRFRVAGTSRNTKRLAFYVQLAVPGSPLCGLALGPTRLAPAAHAATRTRPQSPRPQAGTRPL